MEINKCQAMMRLVLLGCFIVSTSDAASTEPGFVHAEPPLDASETAKPVRVSPYALAARRHALKVATSEPLPVMPPSQRRTRQAIGQAQQY